jgi:hypothetical protein
MKLFRVSTGISSLLVCVLTLTSADARQAKSQWVSINTKGEPGYKTTARGDKIMDFSYAGYMGGGVALPAVPVKITLQPIKGDNSDAIQHAVDEVAAMPLVNGFRGAVLLAAGTYETESPINITASGVVVRGSGSGENGTVINLAGKPHACVVVKATINSKLIGNATTITDAYVPCAAISFQVADASVFAVGDTVRITRPVTASWVKFMGMDTLVRDGKKQTWVTGDISSERVIRKVDKNRVTVDIPLNDSYDLQYAAISVQKVQTSGGISQVGIEKFRIVSPAQPVTITEGHHRAFTMSGLADGWARDIEILNTVNSISIEGKRITVDHVNIMHTAPTIGAAKPADLNGSGPQVLFNQCTITGDNVFFFATGAKVSGPVVLLNCIFKGNGWIQPHQRWATGVLADNCQVPDGGIDFMNRGTMGSGHGWAIGWAVAWNCTAKSYLNQMPPGAANWVIGSKGEHQFKAIPFQTKPFLEEGIYDSHGVRVNPSSLYLAQLDARLGKQALKNIGY